MIDRAFGKRLFFQHIDFIRFCMVGGTNTLLSFVIYWILLNIGVNYLVASSFSYAAGIVSGYILSTTFVFKRARERNSFIRFFLVYFSSMIFNLSIMYIAVDYLLLNKLIAQTIAMGINVVYNFSINKIWTFK